MKCGFERNPAAVRHSRLRSFDCPVDAPTDT
jgi:hypothetical protein